MCVHGDLMLWPPDISMGGICEEDEEEKNSFGTRQTNPERRKAVFIIFSHAVKL